MPERKKPSSTTRAAQRERSRTKLLEVAVQRIAECGIEGTSVQDVARRAGMTTGAVYHQFAGKDDLVRATMAFALDHPSIYQDAADSATTVAELLIGAALAELHLVDDFDNRVAQLLRVQLHLVLAAPHNEKASDAITSFIRTQVDELRDHIERVAAAEGRRLQVPMENLAREYFALVRGFILFRLADQGLADDALVSAAIERMVASACTSER